MKKQPQTDFDRTAQAIDYIIRHYRQQPSLEQVAEQVHLSPSHLQRIFSRWAGVSPKKFQQYLSLSHAKRLFRTQEATLFDAAHQTGLSGTGRLHDLFVHIEGMTPGEYKNAAGGLTIRYAFGQTLFGPVLTASTGKGLCFMGFADDPRQTLGELERLFPRASYLQEEDSIQQEALSALQPDHRTGQLTLHLKGTGFQLKVWEALLSIPPGEVASYGELARRIGRPTACRAVGSAVGDNPVSLLIPCHRVIQSTGAIGGYHWGPDRKAALLGWEAALNESITSEP